ncbi:unnamed protein product [Mytilus coruscus]|uniref:Uncharacterized protein n=1 Tax=Mytilus coruscus TaxID=42192 RepID=A0A6J8C8E7_MYTCO|nr:unnamed protein product [Mytilus coruscus]
MRTTANLTVRNDIGKINSSPISTMKPIVRMKYGFIQDDDADIVKCRWSTNIGNDECGNVCQAFPGSVLDEVSCILHYNATFNIGWFVVAVQIEDFAVSNDMVPLSSVSLQFLVQVFTSSGDCEDRPVLVVSNFIDGADFHISLYSTLNETIIARSSSNTSVIIEITTVSPIGMVKSDLKVFGGTGREWYVTVTWIPTEDQIGSHIFCYTAIDSGGQSTDQTCVTLVVNGQTTTIEQTRNNKKIRPNNNNRATNSFNINPLHLRRTNHDNRTNGNPETTTKSDQTTITELPTASTFNPTSTYAGQTTTIEQTRTPETTTKSDQTTITELPTASTFNPTSTYAGQTTTIEQTRTPETTTKSDQTTITELTTATTCNLNSTYAGKTTIEQTRTPETTKKSKSEQTTMTEQTKTSSEPTTKISKKLSTTAEITIEENKEKHLKQKPTRTSNPKQLWN